MTLTENGVQELIQEIQRIVDGADDDILLSVCSILKERVDHYDWVGFYIVDPEAERELVLGSFAGESTEHTRISFGEGICGQAADTGKLFLIQDVSKESNYLSCSPEVKSEIVLPVYREGEIVGELDIDSHRLGPFTDLDSKLLGRICEMVAPFL